jgi:hypothetical protein
MAHSRAQVLGPLLNKAQVGFNQAFLPGLSVQWQTLLGCVCLIQRFVFSIL